MRRVITIFDRIIKTKQDRDELNSLLRAIEVYDSNMDKVIVDYKELPIFNGDCYKVIEGCEVDFLKYLDRGEETFVNGDVSKSLIPMLVYRVRIDLIFEEDRLSSSNIFEKFGN